MIHSFNTEPEGFAIKSMWEEAQNIRTFVLEGTLNSKPGQFCMLWIPGIDEKPFSIAKDDGEEVWLTICNVGKFTEQLFQLQIGDIVGLRGAFGHGFSVLKKEEKPKKIVLIGGGYGSAPLHFTASKNQEQGHDISIIIGARDQSLLIWEDKCRESGFTTYITTDNGSKGIKGFTTDVLRDLITQKKVDFVQTCGPEKMMKIIAEMCQENEIPCEVSIERYMKCGFGICGQCVTESGEKMCQTGPVVDCNIALTYPDFGVFHRGSEGQKILW